MRDGDKKRYQGKGVLKAAANVNGPINQLLKAYALFDTDKVTGPEKNDIVEKAIGEFIFSIRKDLLSRRIVRKTLLSASSYRLQAPNPEKFKKNKLPE